MDYDFVVVGGGSAGYAAARTAVELGLKTLVIEGGPEVGGLCILRGCMPSKTLIESANRMMAMRQAGEFGLRTGEIGFVGEEIIARKRRLIGEFADYRRGQLEEGSFDFLRGSACFTDGHTLEVALVDGGKKSVTARTALLATGSKISAPPVPGLDTADCLTSDDVLDLAEVPASIIVLGAGPVALEMAHYFAALDREVTVVQRSGQLLTGVDTDLAAVVEKSLRSRGVKVFTGTQLEQIERDGEIRRVTFLHDGKKITIEADAVLNGLGRKPRTDGLGLDAAGIQLSGSAIGTNSHQQTSCAHILAAGDCAGPFEVVHIAVEQGELAARNAAKILQGGEELESMDYRMALFAVFTEPQVAVVGLSETDAKKRGIPYLSASYPFDDHGKSLVMGETEGFVKLLVDPESREILGGALVGPHASDLIHEIVVAMRFRATAGQLALIPHYHPTLSEIWTYPAGDLAE